MQERTRRRRQLTPEERLKNARQWLSQRARADLLGDYRQRYNVGGTVAYVELLQLGYGDDLKIQEYERQGIAWEYKVDGYTGDMKVVPKGTPDWELHLY